MMPLTPNKNRKVIQKKAMGGGIGAPVSAVPQGQKKGGLLLDTGSGRSDTMKATVPEGSFIIPADVVSAFGDGNTLAGAKALDSHFEQDSSKPVQAAPSAPPPGLGFANGGRTKSAGKPVPILGSGGEYVVLPSSVARKGGGDIAHGHDILSKMVVKKRSQYAKKLKSLPKPKK